MFANNILFVNVSKTPNVKVIVQNLFSYKGIKPTYQIQSDEDAICQLPQMLSHIGPSPILLILDDVWLGSEFLLEKFKFNIPNYKILVTSRTAFPRFKHKYNLKQLNDVDAMTLFCHSAFLQDESSYIPEEDIKKVLGESVIYISEDIHFFYGYIHNIKCTLPKSLFLLIHTFKLACFVSNNPTFQNKTAKKGENFATHSVFIFLNN